MTLALSPTPALDEWRTYLRSLGDGMTSEQLNAWAVLELAAQAERLGRTGLPPGAKLRPDQVLRIRARLALRDSVWSLARRFHVDPRTIYQIANGQSWRWVTAEASPTDPDLPPPSLN